jgi:hypothetical protein
MKLEKRSAFGWPATAAGYAPCKNGIVVHYDGSNQGLAGKSHEACRTYWRNTRRFHMSSARGWADIGYSFAVCPHGIVMEGRGWQKQQAAQPGGNSTWTSVTFMSGDKEQPTAAQVNAFKELRAWLRGKGLAAAIKGHRDFISTSCPGLALYGLVRDGSLTGSVQEDEDMPLSNEDLNKIRDIVWNTDTAPRPTGSAEDNPTWRHVNILRDTYSAVREVQGLVVALAGQVPDVDEAAIAQHVVNALPETLAQQVLDGLRARLES